MLKIVSLIEAQKGYIPIILEDAVFVILTKSLNSCSAYTLNRLLVKMPRCISKYQGYMIVA